VPEKIVPDINNADKKVAGLNYLVIREPLLRTDASHFSKPIISILTGFKLKFSKID